MSTRHIVRLSGGMASAVSLFRVLERYGDATPVFADVKQESRDLYRFLDDVEKVSGVPIVRLGGDKDCWDVWFERMMLVDRTKGRGCIASYHLKKQRLEKWTSENCDPATTTVHLGYGPDEDDRVARLKGSMHWKLDFPLRWQPRMWRCDLEDDLRRRGIEPSAAYSKGYPHDNCNGACVLAGIKQWLHLLVDDRETYLMNEHKEQEFLSRLRAKGRKEMTILRDRRGGTTKNLSLRQLRHEHEVGERPIPKNWRIESCSCMAEFAA